MREAEAIAWINDPAPDGQWGSPNELTLPINERGLLLADGLFETVLILDGQPRLLAEHLGRWHHSAALLGLAKPLTPGESPSRQPRPGNQAIQARQAVLTAFGCNSTPTSPISTRCG